MLTGGRFEFGIGTGLPHAITQAAQEFGLPLRSGAERLAAVSEAIDHLHALDGDTHTPVLMAAGGPRARALAAEKADTVTSPTRWPLAPNSPRWSPTSARTPGTAQAALSSR